MPDHPTTASEDRRGGHPEHPHRGGETVQRLSRRSALPAPGTPTHRRIAANATALSARTTPNRIVDRCAEPGHVSRAKNGSHIGSEPTPKAINPRYSARKSSDDGQTTPAKTKSPPSCNMRARGGRRVQIGHPVRKQAEPCPRAGWPEGRDPGRASRLSGAATPGSARRSAHHGHPSGLVPQRDRREACFPPYIQSVRMAGGCSDSSSSKEARPSPSALFQADWGTLTTHRLREDGTTPQSP